jgi:glycerol-1-phosphate dehydrogenase [NAD(P)+]
MSTLWPLPKIEIVPWREISEDRPVGLITTHNAWQAAREKLPFTPVWVGEVENSASADWEVMAADFQGDVIYALGGGLAFNAAKYLAAWRALPLICLPTAFSSDAFLTPLVEVHEGHTVRFLRSVTPANKLHGVYATNGIKPNLVYPPEQVVIDFNIIASAPSGVRAAGICDILSLATAGMDWHFAAVRRRNLPETPYMPYIVQTAQGALQGAYDCAEAAERGDPAGLKQLLDCLCLETELCNLLGHERLKIGSEHYITWALDEFGAGGNGLRASRLAPGLLLAAELLDSEASHVRRALHNCHIPFTGATVEQIQTALGKLVDYCRQQGFPYGVAFELTPSRVSFLNIKEILEME